MPRPLSWLPRLHEIRRAVAHSVRSHYTRQDLEGLFELQPRAAQKLIEMLPSTQLGSARLVERDELERFLAGVHEAEDVPAYLESVRAVRHRVSRRRPRSLVRADLPRVELASLPDSIRLTPGRLEVSFRTIEELAEAMLTLARVLESDEDDLVRLCALPTGPSSTS